MLDNPTEAVYLPCMVSVAGSREFLRSKLPTDGIDLSHVLLEMLNNFFSVGMRKYGRYEGPLGAYKIQAPENLPITDDQIDRVIHEAEYIMIEDLTSCLPEMNIQTKRYYFRYPGDDAVLLFVPVNPHQLHPELAKKVITYQQVRDFLEGSI